MLQNTPSPEWRIYYGDGSTFDSLQGSPWEAPGYDVQCIVYPDEDVGRVVLHRWDFYLYNLLEKEWYGSDLLGLMDHLCHDREQSFCAVKQGRTITTPQFRSVFQRASHDPDFPTKSATSTGERP